MALKNIYLLLLAKPKPEPEIGCEIALFEGLRFENGLKEFHSSLFPSFFFFFPFFFSEIDLCLDRQPVYCSSQVRMKMTLAM